MSGCFSPGHSKRLDFAYTSEKHANDWAEDLSKNDVDPYFQSYVKRTIYPGSITEIKKASKSRMIKLSWISSSLGRVELGKVQITVEHQMAGALRY